jgi:hypothetical protein
VVPAQGRPGASHGTPRQPRREVAGRRASVDPVPALRRRVRGGADSSRPPHASMTVAEPTLSVVEPERPQPDAPPTRVRAGSWVVIIAPG